MTRLVAAHLSSALKQTVVVDNRPGAGGLIGVKQAISAKPDGHTFVLLYTDNVTVAPFLQKPRAFDPFKDLAYVGTVARSNPFILAVNPKVPANTFAEFIALAKSAPRKVSYSTYGIGSVPQLGFEMMAAQAAVEMVHAPYKGGAASYQAAVAGDVNAVAGTSFTELLRSGKLRPLAIGGNKRSMEFPEIPTFAELGYGDQIFSPVYYGLAAPAGTPKEIIARVAEELRLFTQTPDMPKKLAAFATEPFYADPSEFRKIAERGANLYAPMIEKLGLSTQ
jgi:tripartite-type tricarboxylate transporter receptor subunit TctC